MTEHTPTLIAMVLVFTAGYLAIIFEHILKINKASSALLMGVTLWILQFSEGGIAKGENLDQLYHHLSSSVQVILFLLGALIIVEMVNIHNGFKINLTCRGNEKILKTVSKVY